MQGNETFLVGKIPPPDANVLQLLQEALMHKMSSDEAREQAISWAYGQLAIDDDRVTKESIRRAADELYGNRVRDITEKEKA